MFSNDPRIKPYVFKGLEGRYIHVKAKDSRKKRVFLVIYGQHASIERCLPLLDALSRFGEVYLADAPGFGGMDPAYKARRKPTLTFFAENIKNVFDTILPKNKKITVFSVSFGFQQITRFLYEYPEYKGRIEDLVSFVGLASYRNFRISRTLETSLKHLTGSGKTYLGAKIYQGLIFQHPIFVRKYYERMTKKQPKFKNLNKEEASAYAREQAWLWQINERRTHAHTANDFLFRTDLTNLKIDMPVTHVGVPNDHFLDNKQVVDDLHQIYSSVIAYDLDLPGHSPISLDSPEEVLELFPKTFADKLKKSDNT